MKWPKQVHSSRPLRTLVGIVLISSLLTTALAAQVVLSDLRIQSSYAVKETHRVPVNIKRVGAPDPDEELTLRIGLKQGNFEDLRRRLYEVSDPSHAKYGQHLSKRQVEDIVRPRTETTEMVSNWLLDHGIGSESYEFNSAGDWISLKLPISRVEKLLATEYSEYEHPDGTKFTRTTHWSVPLALHDHITTIQPTTAFNLVSASSKKLFQVPGDFEAPAATLTDGDASIEAVCNFSAVTPVCLRTLYSTLNYKPQSSPGGSVGFTNYLGEISNRSDAEAFLSRFRPEAVSSARSHKQISIDGGIIDNGTVGAGVEGNLDLETILGLAYPLPVTAWSTAGSPPFIPDKVTPRNTNEPYLAWLNYILATEDSEVPSVISTSYGDDEQTVPQSYAQTVCNAFAQLGARGVTVLFSSGDFGVGLTGACLSNDGKNTTKFLPEFPSSCPYVTAVGGTMEYPEKVAYDPRNGYASGSGFSNYFERPEWQDDVVESYIDALNGTFNGLYNASGRAYPDLAAQGFQYLVVYGERVIGVDGTSCSAPAVAGILGLVNDALLAKGKSTLGWLNPWLYKNGGKDAFNDVLAGSSIGCAGNGFEAAPGWDIASGWGTPDFLKIVKSLGVD